MRENLFRNKYKRFNQNLNLQSLRIRERRKKIVRSRVCMWGGGIVIFMILIL